jgi:hypothetical protein
MEVSTGESRELRTRQRHLNLAGPVRRAATSNTTRKLSVHRRASRRDRIGMSFLRSISISKTFVCVTKFRDF